ncbi:hypothetical protein PNEG_03408 [Pneumocystis murina B123]|uniref:ARID domain-containing protein n=1 Tax=Pneumocystis murina (strain B123) TaxID=1069680 RepID=M7P330_PNEMU|nr:hypothetical protein PNEG_03408 [Pneumocystis murina B123]EMR08240.1 hypothetical protein PNEG_03408 [Pneumocystis murina B123]
MRGKGLIKITDDDDIERNEEYNEFIKDLEAYHIKRGTGTFVREPIIGPHRIDLLKLYKRVIELGGYDKVSSEKSWWKNLSNHYKLPPMSNAGYLLKSIYYKNLAAWEMEKHWKKTPPAPEHLEFQTAKGGDIMTRTAENYQVTTKEDIRLDSSSPMPLVRNLRAAPAPRTFYQPDERLTQARSALQKQAQQQLQMQAQQQPFSTHFATSTFPEDVNNKLQPQPVITPANTHALEYLRNSTYGSQNGTKIGAGIQGAPFMVRIALALKSGLVSELDWALHHLVRLSYEQGNNLRFDRIPDLAETLIKKLYEFLKQVSRKEMEFDEENDDWSMDYQSRKALDKILEAALILRNLALLSDNASYLARLEMTHPTLVLGIKQMDDFSFIELKHYCMDIIEAVSFYTIINDENDDLYLSLCELLQCDDRAMLIGALRALARLALHDTNNRLLQNISPYILYRVRLLLSLDDEELLGSALDFMYQYTTYKANTQSILELEDIHDLIDQLVRLMMFQAEEKEIHVSLSADIKQYIPTGPPPLPAEIVQELLGFGEPDRAVKWMRVCYQESSSDDITQMHLWQSYQARFSPFIAAGRPLLSAADLIKIASRAFPKAKAMVLNAPEGQSFIIRGVRPREIAISIKGESYVSCKWVVETNDSGICGSQFPNSQELFKHIIDHHLPEVRLLSSSAPPLVCKWFDCTRFTLPGEKDRFIVLSHLRTHIPDKLTQFVSSSLWENISIHTKTTAVDERGEAIGVALTATLILRNLAKSKHRQDLFINIENSIIHVVAQNPVLSTYLSELLVEIQC